MEVRGEVEAFSMSAQSIKSPSHRQGDSKGKLYLVGTPIGNLGDITLRALQILKEVDLVACEDTRQTRKLLNHYKIQKPTLSYHEHNEVARAPALTLKLKQGVRIALVSDAGMPLISDPGYRLVKLAIQSRVNVIPVPGASSFAAALAASGLPVKHFSFQGFLPARRFPRRKVLERMRSLSITLVFYEAPQRLKKTLEEIQNTLGDRQVAVAREITKVHEEFLRGRISLVLEQLDGRSLKGEITLIVGPPDEQSVLVERISPAEEVVQAMKEKGLKEKEAMKAVAKAHGLSRSEVYRLLQRQKSGHVDGQEEG